MAQCSLCSSRDLDDDGGTIYGHGREFIEFINKLVGLEPSCNEGKICKRCNADLENVQQFIQRVTNSRQETQAGMVAVTDPYSDDGQLLPLIDNAITDLPGKDTVVVSLPSRYRRRRPPKRFEDNGMYTFKSCKTTNIVNMSNCRKNIRNSTLDNLPKMAYIQVSSSSDLIGDLVEVHRNGKHSRLRILCRKCSEVFTFEKEFLKHYASSHGKKDKENKALFFCGGTDSSPESVENILYVCTICNRTFQEHFNARRHYKTSHNEERKFKCEKCPATFKYKFNMDYHMARHLDLKVHQCPQCQKKFVLRYELQIHLRIHTGQRPFKCQTCPRSFAHRSNLLTHCQTHKLTRDLNFKCKQCKASFRNRLYLRRHEERVHKKAKVIAEINDDCGGSVYNTNSIHLKKQNTFDNGQLQNILEAEKPLSICSTELTAIDRVPENTPSLNMPLTEFVKIDDFLPNSTSTMTNVASLHQCITPSTSSHITRLPKNFKIIKIPKTNEHLHLTQSLVSDVPTNVMKTPDIHVTPANSQPLVLRGFTQSIKLPSPSLNSTNCPILSKDVDTSFGKSKELKIFSPNYLKNKTNACIWDNIKSGQLERHFNSSNIRTSSDDNVTALSSCTNSPILKIDPNKYCGTAYGELVTLDHFQHTTRRQSPNPKSCENHNLIITNVDAKDKLIYTQVKKICQEPDAAVAQHLTSSEMPFKAKRSQANDGFVNQFPSAEVINLTPVKSVLKTNFSSQISLRKTPIKCKISPYSLLKQHVQKALPNVVTGQQSPLINRSPSQPIIRKVEILPTLNLQEVATTSSPNNSVKIPAEFKFQCPKCWKYLKRKSDLNKHMRTHTGVKPYKCNLCPKAYADASNYKKHKLLHTKAADALNISRPKPSISPALSTASDPDPDGVEAMQTIQRFELSSDEDDMESYLWHDALQHSLQSEEIRENIKLNLMAISNAIMPAEGFEGARLNLLSSNYFPSENPD